MKYLRVIVLSLFAWTAVSTAHAGSPASACRHTAVYEGESFKSFDRDSVPLPEAVGETLASIISVKGTDGAASDTIVLIMQRYPARFNRALVVARSCGRDSFFETEVDSSGHLVGAVRILETPQSDEQVLPRIFLTGGEAELAAAIARCTLLPLQRPTEVWRATTCNGRLTSLDIYQFNNAIWTEEQLQGEPVKVPVQFWKPDSIWLNPDADYRNKAGRGIIELK